MRVSVVTQLLKWYADVWQMIYSYELAMCIYIRVSIECIHDDDRWMLSQEEKAINAQRVSYRLHQYCPQKNRLL